MSKLNFLPFFFISNKYIKSKKKESVFSANVVNFNYFFNFCLEIIIRNTKKKKIQKNLKGKKNKKLMVEIRPIIEYHQ